MPSFSINCQDGEWAGMVKATISGSFSGPNPYATQRRAASSA